VSLLERSPGVIIAEIEQTEVAIITKEQELTELKRKLTKLNLELPEASFKTFGSVRKFG
jgi:hypothetical protein